MDFTTKIVILLIIIFVIWYLSKNQSINHFAGIPTFLDFLKSNDINNKYKEINKLLSEINSLLSSSPLLSNKMNNMTNKINKFINYNQFIKYDQDNLYIMTFPNSDTLLNFIATNTSNNDITLDNIKYIKNFLNNSLKNLNNLQQSIIILQNTIIQNLNNKKIMIIQIDTLSNQNIYFYNYVILLINNINILIKHLYSIEYDIINNPNGIILKLTQLQSQIQIQPTILNDNLNTIQQSQSIQLSQSQPIIQIPTTQIQPTILNDNLNTIQQSQSIQLSQSQPTNPPNNTPRTNISPIEELNNYLLNISVPNNIDNMIRITNTLPPMIDGLKLIQQSMVTKDNIEGLRKNISDLEKLKTTIDNIINLYKNNIPSNQNDITSNQNDYNLLINKVKIESYIYIINDFIRQTITPLQALANNYIPPPADNYTPPPGR